MKKLVTALFLASLTACASHYGNYTKISDLYNEQMADDTAGKLLVLYPPASTHFVLSQDAKDAFGAELSKKLRENGYAIEENSSISSLLAFVTSAQPAPPAEAHKQQTGNESAAVPPAKKDVSAAPGRSIGYIVDQIGDGLYRVTIEIDSKVLNRVYTGSSKGIVPAGSWTRKE